MVGRNCLQNPNSHRHHLPLFQFRKRKYKDKNKTIHLLISNGMASRHYPAPICGLDIYTAIKLYSRDPERVSHVTRANK